jgi:hypothetical protein
MGRLQQGAGALENLGAATWKRMDAGGAREPWMVWRGGVTVRTNKGSSSILQEQGILCGAQRGWQLRRHPLWEQQRAGEGRFDGDRKRKETTPIGSIFDERSDLNTVRVAQVGWNETSDDYYRSMHVWKKLVEIDHPISGPRDCDNDNINLHTGRDFLIEDKQYDVVVLHYIFNPKLSTNLGMFAQSPHHSIDRWINRLIDSRAQVIVTFGGYTEVSQCTIGPISGYVLESHGDWGIYQLDSSAVLTKCAA